MTLWNCATFSQSKVAERDFDLLEQSTGISGPMQGVMLITCTAPPLTLYFFYYLEGFTYFFNLKAIPEEQSVRHISDTASPPSPILRHVQRRLPRGGFNRSKRAVR
jgi:hypothetical protein